MKSKLIFRHIKNNILRYTVTFSAAVHLIGIFMFPSWGTAPQLVEEKTIKIKTVLKQPENPIQKKLSEPKEIHESAPSQPRTSSQPMKESEATIPKVREITPRVRSAKAAKPSLAIKNISSSIHFTKQIFQPMKAIRQNSPTPHPSASLQKTAEMKILPTSPERLHTAKAKIITTASFAKLTERQPSNSFVNTSSVNIHSRARQTIHTSEISSPRPALERKHLTQVFLVNKPQESRTVSANTQIGSLRLKAQPTRILSTTRLNINYSDPQPTRATQGLIGNEFIKTLPLIHSRTIQHLDRKSTPTGIKGFTLMVDSAPDLEISEHSPKSFDSNTSNPIQGVVPIFGKDATPSLGKTNLVQLASIPSGFIEEPINGETIKGDGGTIKNPLSKNNISTDGIDGINELSADKIGKIKSAFSSQVRTKIAQTKYYPRMARKRGFEGEPVVAFTLGTTGDLLEITIKNPSKHKLLDEAALKAVRSASPYPPIPDLLKLKTLRFKLPISFILEEQ